MHCATITCRDGRRGCCKQNHHPQCDAFSRGILEQRRGRNHTELFLELQIFASWPNNFQRKPAFWGHAFRLLWGIWGSYGDTIRSIQVHRVCRVGRRRFEVKAIDNWWNSSPEFVRCRKDSKAENFDDEPEGHQRFPMRWQRLTRGRRTWARWTVSRDWRDFR